MLSAAKLRKGLYKLDFSFKKSVDSQYKARVAATAPVKEVDAYIFCTSSKYLGERLFPFQSLLIKVMYGLWEKYPISEDEQKVIDYMKNVWYIDWNLTKRDPKKFIEILILVLGRRCLKGSEKVLDPITGEQIPIEKLYKRQAAQVLTLDKKYRLQKTNTTTVYDNGTKTCYKLTTRTGRNISATSNHPFLTIDG